MFNTDAIIIHQFNIGESLRNVLYCASFKQSLNKLSYYYKHTQTVPIWQHPACLSWCTSLGLPVARMTSCLMLRTGQQQSTQSYRWNLQGGKNQNSVFNFQCKTCPSNAQKRSFIQCIIIYKKVKREELTLAYLILIQYIYIKESEKSDFYSMYL